MGTGYTRNDASNNIADGNVINASDLDGEFDAIESAFGTSGHTHDGTAAEGGAITKVGPVQDIVVSATNLNPKTNNTIDLGTASLKYKDAHFQGSIDTDGVITAATFEPDGDTAAGDAAAIGYTAAEGLILTGQGSTSDITLKNDADAVVFTVPTGTDDILFPDNAKAMFGAGSDLQIYHDGSNSYIEDTATGGLILKSNGPSIAFQKGDGSELFTVSTSGGFTATDGSTITVDDNSVALNLVSTDTDASQGPILRLSRDVVGAASDVIGTIHYYAQDVAGNDTQYAEIEGRIGDATNGAEDGELVVSTMLAGTSRARLKFDSTEAVFNDGSLDLDFRVESNGNANMLFVDGGNNRVGVGTNTPATSLSVAGTGTFDSVLINYDTSQVVGGNEATAQITGVDGGAALSIARHQSTSGGPSLRFAKSRVSTKGDVTIVQDGDQLGRIEFDGADGTDLVTKGAQIEAVVDGTPSADDMPTRLVFSTTADGASSPTERMRLNASGKLSLGNNLTNPDNSLLHLTQNSVDNFSLLQLESNEGSSATAPDIAFYRNSASPADGDNIGALHFYGNNSVGDRTIFGQFYNRVTDVTDGSEDSQLAMLAMQGGTVREFLTIGSNASGTGEVIVNQTSLDIDFRVESNNDDYAFFVDGATGNIGMSSSDPSSHIPVSYNTGKRSFVSFFTGGTQFVAGRSDTATAAGDYVGGYLFKTNDASVNKFGGMVCTADDNSGNGNLEFYPVSNGYENGSEGSMQLDDSGDLYIRGGGIRVGRSHNNVYTAAEESIIIYHQGSGGNDTYTQVQARDGTGADQVFRHQRQGTIKSEIEENGDFLSATNSYGSTSDERLKENIVAASSQWNDIKALQFKNYSMIEDELDAPNMLGVMAQDLQASGMNGLVKQIFQTDSEDNPVLDADGNQKEFLSVKYSVLYMKAIKALQEAMAKIEVLETKVAALEAE